MQQLLPGAAGILPLLSARRTVLTPGADCAEDCEAIHQPPQVEWRSQEKAEGGQSMQFAHRSHGPPE
eukprot:2234003-Rhodomonas_salina.1